MAARLPFSSLPSGLVGVRGCAGLAAAAVTPLTRRRSLLAASLAPPAARHPSRVSLTLCRLCSAAGSRCPARANSRREFWAARRAVASPPPPGGGCDPHAAAEGRRFPNQGCPSGGPAGGSCATLPFTCFRTGECDGFHGKCGPFVDDLTNQCYDKPPKAYETGK